SGSTRPSMDDKRLTEQVKKGAQTMNIHLADHVVVTDGRYYSFSDEGML
ncbi:JAB domain-containing protein, partial [Bacteroides heparinolyticus]